MTNQSLVQKLRKGQNKDLKAISPVIATIILIAVALVLALVVGVFAFGLFSSQTKNVTMESGNFYAATGEFAFSLRNPGTSAVGISSVTLNGVGAANAPCQGGTLTLVSPATTVTWLTSSVSGGTVQTEACGVSGAAFGTGNTYDYVINLDNGQSISGSVVAQ